jgi:hypothetical protein
MRYPRTAQFYAGRHAAARSAGAAAAWTRHDGAQSSSSYRYQRESQSMPYIEQKDRERARTEPRTAGELNYAITRLVLGFLGDSPRYQNFNDAIGALEGAKLELYRRVVAPYEDRKIVENGDVY